MFISFPHPHPPPTHTTDSLILGCKYTKKIQHPSRPPKKIFLHLRNPPFGVPSCWGKNMLLGRDLVRVNSVSTPCQVRVTSDSARTSHAPITPHSRSTYAPGAIRLYPRFACSPAHLRFAYGLGAIRHYPRFDCCPAHLRFTYGSGAIGILFRLDCCPAHLRFTYGLGAIRPCPRFACSPAHLRFAYGRGAIRPYHRFACRPAHLRFAYGRGAIRPFSNPVLGLFCLVKRGLIWWRTVSKARFWW